METCKLVFRVLRTFAPNFSNIDFFLEILPLKDDESVMSEMKKKMGGRQLRLGRTPKKSLKSGFFSE